MPELNLEHVIRLRDALIDIHSGKLKSNGIYPVSYKVDERVELLSEPQVVTRLGSNLP